MIVIIHPMMYNCERTKIKREEVMEAKTLRQKSQALQQMRRKAGLSQTQLAAAAGISSRVLQNYEQGIRDLSGAKLATLLKICNALNCSLGEIIADEETRRLLEVYEKHTG